MAERDLVDWEVRLEAAGLPVPARLRAACARLDPEGPVQGWGALYGRDPLLAAATFRAVNGSRRACIASLDQAPALLGIEPFLDLGRQGPTVEAALAPEARPAYVRTLRRAHGAGMLASTWAGAQGYREPPRFYYSAAFLYLGEILVRLLDPPLARRVDMELGWHPGGWQGPEAGILGFPAEALALRLAQRWHLPQLADMTEADAPGRLVRLAVVSAGAAARDPLGPELDEALHGVAALGSTRMHRARRDLFAAMARAARDAVDWYPEPGDARFVPFYPRTLREQAPEAASAQKPAIASPPGKGRPDGAPKASLPAPGPRAVPGRSQPATPRSEPAAARSRAATPRSEPAPSRSRAATPRSEAEASRSRAATPRSEPEASRSQAAAPRSEPEASRSQAAAPRSEPAESPSGPAAPRSEAPRSREAVLQGAVRTLVTRLGLGQAMFARLRREPRELVGLYFARVPEGAALRGSAVPVARGSPLASLLAKGGPAWVGRPELGGDRQLLEALEATPYEAPCFLAPVRLEGRPIGLLYADARGAERVLDGAAWGGFQRVQQSLEAHLLRDTPPLRAAGR